MSMGRMVYLQSGSVCLMKDVIMWNSRSRRTTLLETRAMTGHHCWSKEEEDEAARAAMAAAAEMGKFGRLWL